MNPISMH